MNTQTKWVQTEEKRLEIAKAIATLQLEVNKLQREEDLKYIKDTIKAIADGFGNAITESFQDLFDGKDVNFWNSIREGVGTGMKSAAASNIGDIAQKTVFGNKGLLAGMLRNTPFAGIVDDIFPKTQLEVAQDSLAELKDISNKLGPSALLSGKGGNTIGATRIDWGTIGGWIASLFGFGGGGGRNMQGSHGYQMAMGGVAPGGFRAFAKGGIANRPTLGMVGEGKYNEAVVPLPDGKSIPVIGGGGNNVTVNVSVDAQGQSAATETTGSGARELGYMLSQAVQQELVHQQRPGGLLSAY